MLRARTSSDRGTARHVVILALAGVLAGAAVAIGLLVPESPPAPTRVSGGEAPPTLSVSEPLLDFGEMSPNAKATLDFSISNDGPEAVRLQGFTSSCGCLWIVDDVPRALAPGGRLTLQASLESPAYQTLPIRHTLQLHYGSNGRMIELPVVARTSPVVAVEQIADGADARRVVVRSLNGGLFSVEETPWFAAPSDDAPRTRAAEVVLTIDATRPPPPAEDHDHDHDHAEDRSGVELVIDHEEVGRVRLPWRDPASLPREQGPPMLPAREDVVLTAAQVREGASVDVPIHGPTERDIEHISVDRDSLPGAKVSIESMEATPQGVLIRVRVEGDAARWGGGRIQFSWKDGRSTCTLRVRREPPGG